MSFGLLDAFRFGQAVIDARWHEGTGRWHVVTDRGLTVTGLNNVVSWGLYIVAFMFLVGLSAGGLIVVAGAHRMVVAQASSATGAAAIG